MKYNPEKHRRRSIRLPRYDYSKSGAYYITICSKDHECIFGDIQENVGAEASSAPTVGRIIQAFKLKCATDYLKYIKENNLDMIGKVWQKNYYEHIIRNESELEKIREYIINNPLNWADDEENPLNINKQKPTKKSTGLVPRR